MSVLKKLTEGIVDRSLAREGAALLNKWENTGLLEGLESDQKKQGMARLLENQAAQLLREASSMAGGDVEGFASVAFPIVRRVFGGLLANDLVSVQPMSLPSGLIFFMDFTYTDSHLGTDAGDSLYGGGVVASQLTGGVSDITEDGGGFYNLANAYAHATGTVVVAEAADADPFGVIDEGEIADDASDGLAILGAGTAISALTHPQKKALRFDVDVLNSTTSDLVACFVARVTDATMAQINKDNLGAIQLNSAVDGTEATYSDNANSKLLRRLTHLGVKNDSGSAEIESGSEANYISFYSQHPTGATVDTNAIHISFPLVDTFAAGGGVGSVVGSAPWGLEGAGSDNASSFNGQNVNSDIAEIDIKVDSVAVTAMTKKLKAKWSPELGQDLNAYHNLDAEVELTQLLSEQIALEIDREIVKDLIEGGKAGTFYWSRSPGLFVNRTTGAELGALSAAPDFTGTVSEWYETLIETINDVSAQIHRKTLRGGANFLVTSPEVANILEFTAGFRANVTADVDKGSVGAVNIGSMSKKWDVFVDPYFPRNLVLVGRKGGSFLESGYVYAPYVPLQVTPTIFGVEDFVPRKGVMTRYAKKMVRPDMYGLVVVRGLLGEAGATS
jgi:hypothetical protein